jgi:hypothetical protein
VHTLATSRGLTTTADMTAAPAAATVRSAKVISLSATGSGGGVGDSTAWFMAARGEGRARNLDAERDGGRARKSRGRGGIGEEARRRWSSRRGRRVFRGGSVPLASDVARSQRHMFAFLRQRCCSVHDDVTIANGDLNERSQERNNKPLLGTWTRNI